ncbi:DUF421 domain-containing protein [Anaerobacillus sp. CMMVII]|uniref:DUF421 domain-containing protein n=1 Tax=Anaerobacillus sp. CMMVII TaxID=2755588 RepID=UPI0021B6F80B|nr:DUF421 domain-containing protein [Anaerobacillus sp. CMMVII]MCT8138561.1 DUF421 domain-containing protein [Anaerobacillus sp. CMMVII]
MVIETIKLATLFLLVFMVMRFLGKTLLSQWTAYDLVTIIFLSYSALGAVKIKSFFQALVSIFIIAGLYLLLSKVSLVPSFTKLIIGEPTILIKHGKIINKNLKKIRYSLAELLSTVRAFGYPDIQAIEYAILEPNGKISVIPMPNLVPLTPKHMNLEVEYQGLPITVIAQGRIQIENLKLIEKTEAWLRNELKNKGYEQIETIFYAYTKDNSDTVTVFPYK